MRPAQLPMRLLAETLAIVGGIVAALGALLPALAPVPQLPPVLGALVVVLLAAPPIYWRSMHAVRQAAVPAATPPTPKAVSVEHLDMRRRRAIVTTALTHLGGVALTAFAAWYVHTRTHANGPLAAVVAGGALLSMLLAFLVWALSSARIRAQTFAERMTADLDRLAQVVKHTDNAVMITDPSLRITWVNEGFTRITGYGPQEASGRTPGELLGSGQADPLVLQRLADAAACAQACRVEILNRTKDGRAYWTDTEVQPLFDAGGTLTGFMEIGRDITEQRRAAERLESALRELALERERLQRAEALLRGAIEAVDEAFVLFDPDDRLVFCNDKYREIYASSADLLVPGNSFEHVVRTGAERGQYVEALGRVDDWVAERMAAHRRSNMSLVQRLDNGRWVRVVERRMPDGHIVGFRIDISDLMRANEAAEAASRAKTRFVANMSHEIRTPMNAVLGMLKLLGRTELDARQRDYAGKAERAALALLSLLNDILDFSKVEAGKLELEPRPFSIGHVLHDLSVVLDATLDHKPVELRFDLDPSLPAVVVGDELRLRQVLVNLAGNALKFTERGEVVVTVRQLAREGAALRLEIAVRDTGIGIAPAQQQHIFSAFAQAETSTTRRFGGTGLGLAICQRLVALMGGEIRVESEPGRGSRFSFELELPVADEAAVAAMQPPRDPAASARGSAAAAVARLAGMRLLVVEDNLTNQQVAEELLAGEGAIVHLAADGEQGIAAVAAARTPYDAVLMDVQMPVMDGYSAAAAIRHRLGRTALPIIAMTANTMPGDREASLAAGMNDHVSKPFDLDELVATLLTHAGWGATAAPSAEAPGALPDPVLSRARELGVGLQAAVQRLAGKAPVWVRSARSFALEIPLHLESLEQLLQGGRLDDAARLMHTIKGVAAMLGADALAAAAAAAETQLRSGASAQLAALPARMSRELDHARAALLQLAALLGTGAAPAAPRNPTALVAALATLAPLLAGADMAATDVFADIQAVHEDTWGAELQPLADAMARLDFEAALSACDALLPRHGSTAATPEDIEH